jgi:large subunit ribosomal protein L4
MENQVIEALMYDSNGAEKGKRRLPGAVFRQEVNEAAIYQVIRATLTNRRQGNSASRNRSAVSGGGSKPWRQKGTGRARAGSIRSPLWKGGAVAFRSVPKDYRLKVPRKVRRLALYSSLSQKAREEAVKVLESLEFTAPKTRVMTQLLDKVGVSGKKVLILTEGVKRDVYLSGRNIPKISIHPFKDVSSLDILDADVLLIEDAVIEMLETGERLK